jgi:NTE family protein
VKIMEGTDWGELLMEDPRSDSHTFLNDSQHARYFADVDFDKDGLKTMGGLLEGRNILNYIDRLTLGIPRNADFDVFPRRFRAVATDLATGETVALARGNLADAMRSSMSIPAVFTPYYLDGRYLVDGGVVDNLPVDVARSMGADVVIAVDLEGGYAFDPAKLRRTPIESVTRSLDQMIQANTRTQLASADFVITVDLEGYWVTDFEKEAEILKRGEDSARARMGELRAFMDRLGSLDPGEVSAPAARSGGITDVQVRGAASAQDRAEAKRAYSGVVALADYDAFLEGAYRSLSATDKYQFIRIWAEPSAEGRTLVVSLTKRPASNGKLRLGLSYTAFYSDSVSTRFVATPGIALRGLTGENSQLNVDLTLLDSPGVEALLIQPVLGPLDLRASLSFRREFDTYYDSSPASYQYQRMLFSGGLSLETGFWPHELLSLGWRADWLKGDDISGIFPSLTIRHASILFLSSEFRKVDYPILPTSGINLKGRYALSRPELGSELAFQTLAAKGSLYVPLSARFSLGFRGMLGTDLRASSAGGDAAPLGYMPALIDRYLFPAPLTIEETMGSFVAGGGFDLKLRLERPTGIFTIPFYLIAGVGAGAARLGEPLGQEDGFRCHMNATIGLGLRIDEAFGVYLRGGGSLDSDRRLSPFLAIDIGSIPL